MGLESGWGRRESPILYQAKETHTYTTTTTTTSSECGTAAKAGRINTTINTHKKVQKYDAERLKSEM